MSHWDKMSQWRRPLSRPRTAEELRQNGVVATSPTSCAAERREQ